jgi:predicted enzyme related to lactoylglutathione lyase
VPIFSTVLENEMSRAGRSRTGFECSTPILNVADMSISVRYYVDVLGFKNADWGTGDFPSVNRDRAGIYLCRGGQGRPGTWVWIGVEDVERLHEEYQASGAKIRHAPANYPWAYEMKVEDPDGHVLRFGSEPKDGLPFDEWHD